MVEEESRMKHEDWIILPIVIIMLSGCATTQVDIARAATMCAQNGGVAHHAVKYNNTVRVMCANGARFILPKVK